MICSRVLFASSAWVSCLIAVIPIPEAMAAAPTPVHWTLGDLLESPVPPGVTFIAKLSAQIEPGWHLYAMEESDEGPIATEIGLAEGDTLTLLSVDEPAPRMMPDPMLRRSVGMFQKDASFNLHLRCPHKLPAGSTSHILVRYQTCNEQVCLPPHTETIAFTLSNLLK